MRCPWWSSHDGGRLWHCMMRIRSNIRVVLRVDFRDAQRRTILRIRRWTCQSSNGRVVAPWWWSHSRWRLVVDGWNPWHCCLVVSMRPSHHICSWELTSTGRPAHLSWCWDCWNCLDWCVMVSTRARHHIWICAGSISCWWCHSCWSLDWCSEVNDLNIV